MHNSLGYTLLHFQAIHFTHTTTAIYAMFQAFQNSFKWKEIM